MRNEHRERPAGASRAPGAAVGIPTRRMEFPLPEGKHRFSFYRNNALASSLFAVFSGIFPPGERYFVRSVRRFRDQVQDDALREQVAGFVGQEAMHGREHERLNEWFRAQGYDMDMPERTIRAGLDLLAKLPPSQQLACTTFMEHFTAHLAEQWLTDERFRREADPDVLHLWSWHGLEELEHKAVAFDVHVRVSANPYLERVVAGPLVVAALLPGILFSLGWLVVKQGEGRNFAGHRRGLAALLGRKGFILKVLLRMPEYLAPGFHPGHQNTRALEHEWRERLFGSQGAARDRFRNRGDVEQNARYASA
jgi:predicted metal-dependent hydrolase